LLLDGEKLDALKEALPPEQVHDFVALYLHSAQDHLKLMSEAEAAGDRAAIAAQAHNLVSMAGNVGAMQTSERARDVAVLARGGDAAALAAAVAALKMSVADSSAALQVWLKDHYPARQLSA
jgi:HPt (histidine-containing phosphotransfer) domain-containing protein